MELVHFDDTETVLPGHSQVKIMKCSPVLASFEQAGLLDMFPLHDDELLQKLYAQWSKVLFFISKFTSFLRRKLGSKKL